MTNIPKIGGQGADIVGDNVEALRRLFPEAFTEAKSSDGTIRHKIDFEVLRQLLGDRVVTEGEGKYGLSWHGKDRARQLALTPSAATLRPAPEESVDWDTTQNIMIEGDNLEVLKLLQKSYAGRVKLIYIDPPYNTGNDFVYADDFRDTIGNYLTLTGQSSVSGGKLTSNPETSGRFHTDWLNMMYPRLKLARDLLRDDGMIAVTVDDNEIKNLIHILDDVYGEENRRSIVSWQKKYAVSNNFRGIASIRDFVVIYSKSEAFENGLLPRTQESADRYQNPDNDPRGPWKPIDYWNIATVDQRPNCVYEIINPNTGKRIYPDKKSWKFAPETHAEHVKENKVWWGKSGTNEVPALKLFLNETRDGMIPHNWWPHQEVGHTDEAKKALDRLFGGTAPFDTPKPIRLLNRVMQIAKISDGDLVLDFFAGSGSLGEACAHYCLNQNLNARYILVQLPEQPEASSEGAKQGYSTISDITKERLRRAGAKIKAESPLFTGDSGFRVFKLDRSNIRAWDPDSKDLEASLLDSVNHIIEGRSDQDILYEVLLKQGLDLCVPTQEQVFSGHKVWCIGAGVLFVCLSDRIDRPAAEAIADGVAKWHKALNPATDTRLIFKDSGFLDDVAKTNLTAILSQHGLKDVRSI
ncbi:MAG: site-specific DNA-methyltransferase [Aquidulcibacter sp.]